MDVRNSSKRNATAVATLILLALVTASAPTAARLLRPIDVAHDATTLATAAPVARRADVATVDAVLGVPTFLWGDDAAAALRGRVPSAKAAGDDEATARAHLADLADVYGLTATEIAALPVQDTQRLPRGGAIVRFRGQVDGIEVFREHANVLLDRDGGLVAIGGFVTGAPAGTRKRAADSVQRPELAATAALADFGFGPATALRFTAVPASGNYVALSLPPGTAGADGATLAGDARAKRVWYRNGAELVPAYYVEVRVRDAATPRRIDAYAYVVSATDGSLLFRRNQASHAAFTYRVFAEPAPPFLPYPGPAGRGGFPHPTGTPNGYQPPFVTPNLVTLQNAPFSRNDPWLPPGASRTTGNNVDAFADIVEPEYFGPAAVDECNTALPVNGDMRACATSPGTFDYAYDFTQEPNASRTQVMAAVTHLFYLINYLHDWYYDAGFNEASGNAQVANFGRGGLANDSIIAIAHDYSDVGNAYMITPADGQRPEMHNFVWTSAITLAKVTAPAVVAGTRDTGTADFGAQAFDLTNTLVLAQDAIDATGPSATDGCTAFTNAATVAGRIAVIDRGGCTFVVKAANAQQAGAVAMLIVNNVTPGIINMTGDDPAIAIPALSISQDDGAAIKAQPGATVTIRIARKTGVARDGALDALVVAHEWGHYISNRLVGDSNGLNANQAFGMGEGYADFHAMLLLVKEADRQLPNNANFGGTYSSNAYPLGGPDFPPDLLNNAYYFGDRRYPYTRDMTKNPLTFRHIGNGEPLPAAPAPSLLFAGPDNAEEHNTGEVWGAMLWECYSNLLNDSARLSFSDAQERMKRYLVGGYKLTPIDPTFVTARDAILAVMKAQDVDDHDLCLHGFAKRGAGVGAVAPAALSLNNRGVVESFRTVLPKNGVKATAVEYYHAAFDHYFVTHIADEVAKLDNGTFAGWTRTGESFSVYANAPAGSADVCRFFSTSFTPKSSHFYTPDANECGIVKRNANWQFEAVVFGVLAPGPAGDCPAGSQPVYRLYNNGQGAAPNHRYTTSLATRAQMQGKGWIPEGNGAQGVAMCSPL